MLTNKDIMLTVDYHDENLVIRRLDGATGEERVLQVPTTAPAIEKVIREAQAEVPESGRVIWIMESTTGWARVKELVGKAIREGKVSFVLCNVLEMSLPPKARRKKTDKIDTARMQREALNGTLPAAYQPPRWLRRLRRLVSLRENLVSRRTALRNWIGRFLAHETWEDRQGLWTVRGLDRLARLPLSRSDRLVVATKLDEMHHLETLLEPVEKEIVRFYGYWPAAQRLDEMRGIALISAVSILARIGPVGRFAREDQLIGYAGLAPGVRQSDQTKLTGHIGGGGTDKSLRHYLIEASVWARQIPRYRPAYDRVCHKRGKKIARLVVARMMLRSIYKMLKDDVRFNQLPAYAGVRA